MWFDVYAFRIGGSGSRRIGVLFQNVTGRKQAEAALREKEGRQEFLLKLSDALRHDTMDEYVKKYPRG